MYIAVYGKYLYRRFGSIALSPSSKIRSSRRHVVKCLPEDTA